MKYIKKPIVVEAIQYKGDNLREIFDWLVINDVNRNVIYNTDKEVFEVKTLEGKLFACIGDFIIKGIQDELYPCNPYIFEKTYEKVYDR